MVIVGVADRLEIPFYALNLEEEAVNMIRYQEAYLAASKIITVANELFQSLLNAIR